jgi:hypothetical protein
MQQLEQSILSIKTKIEIICLHKNYNILCKMSKVSRVSLC